MKTVEVNFANLLDQLSEEKINLVVDSKEIIAGDSGSGNSNDDSKNNSSSEVPGKALGL